MITASLGLTNLASVQYIMGVQNTPDNVTRRQILLIPGPGGEVLARVVRHRFVVRFYSRKRRQPVTSDRTSQLIGTSFEGGSYSPTPRA